MSSIIFDFDGTIADSFDMIVDIIHDLLHRDEPLPGDELQRLRGMGLLKVVQELKVRPWKVPFLLARGRRRMRAQMNRVGIFEGIPEVIRDLRGAGYELYIMSSNSVQNIELFLERHNLSQEFVKIYGNIGLLGKRRILKQLVRRNHLDPDETIYIGDEVRDIQAVKQTGVKIVAVTWGFNTEEILVKHHPDFIARDPAELMELIVK